jgi:hypothetical protein
MDQENQIFQLAYQYVNETESCLYLTGKAGTGKTTFLRHVKSNCTKNLVVVAPTGVAAINAGGMTIHSFFQIPFGTFLPDSNDYQHFGENVINKQTLFSKIKLNSTKKKIIQELELLIIDEVSMLRSDLMDAIDTVLKFVRKSHLPFGGVQVLMIGDLFQLPPVVKDNEKKMLETYYRSPFFFDAHVLQSMPVLYLELNKIYRQSEQTFIDLLNEVRHGRLNQNHFALLNARYFPGKEKSHEQAITLTTHNYKAQQINETELNQLIAPLKTYIGEIKGDFNEKQLPVDLELHLKEGAKVMFIKNDTSHEKRYYNGKLAIIEKLVDDEVWVRDPQSGESMQVDRETWDQISYQLSKTSGQIEEKVIGQYIQYPLRLAWAITIHKSQGLTFEQAIIDAGASFAAGQVYVALSRCTSLEGIILRSTVTASALQVDPRIEGLGKRWHYNTEELKTRLNQDRKGYQLNRIRKLFDLSGLYQGARQIEEMCHQSKTLPKLTEARQLGEDLLHEATTLKKVAEKFAEELNYLFDKAIHSEDIEFIYPRIGKAIHYFINKIFQDMLSPLRNYMQQLESTSKIKKYVTVFQEQELAWSKRIDLMQTATYAGKPFLSVDILLDTRPLQPLNIPSKKLAKGESAKQSLAYFLAGKSIAEIATLRNLAMGTIEGHLAEFILQGELEINKVLQAKEVEEIKEAYARAEKNSTTEMKQLLNDKYTHGQIKCAVNHLIWNKEVELK